MAMIICILHDNTMFNGNIIKDNSTMFIAIIDICDHEFCEGCSVGKIREIGGCFLIMCFKQAAKEPGILRI